MIYFNFYHFLLSLAFTDWVTLNVGGTMFTTTRYGFYWLLSGNSLGCEWECWPLDWTVQIWAQTRLLVVQVTYLLSLTGWFDHIVPYMTFLWSHLHVLLILCHQSTNWTHVLTVVLACAKSSASSSLDSTIQSCKFIWNNVDVRCIRHQIK